MTDHVYATHLVWEGSTGSGYRGYPRDHRAVAPPASTTLELSADQHFHGDPSRLNPEQLLVLAASSCQLLSFLAVCALRGVDVLGYEDEAEGFMDDGDAPARFTRITLAPTVRVAPGTDHELVRKLVAEGHEGCYIANSLTTSVLVEPTVLDG